MPAYHALVDAMPGREDGVGRALAGLDGVRAARVKEGSHDFLIRFEAGSFDLVDNFLQTHVRPLDGVLGVQVVTSLDDHGSRLRDVAAKLG